LVGSLPEGSTKDADDDLAVAVRERRCRTDLSIRRLVAVLGVAWMA
jgi:hypothetical protein